MFADKFVTDLNGVDWIGLPDNYNSRTNETTLLYFHHMFNIATIGEMVIYISANNRYKLWINGKMVTVGPLKGDKWHHYYETINIKEYLRPGINVIGVEVLYYQPALYGDNKTAPMSIVTNNYGPLLILKGKYNDVNNNIVDITTGKAKWQVMIDNAINWKVFDDNVYLPIGAMEVVDGSKIPTDWKTKDKPEGNWVDAVKKRTVTAPVWGGVSPLPLFPRQIPHLYNIPGSFVQEMPLNVDDGMSFSQEDKVIIPAQSDMVIELDAGELTTGYLILHTENGKGSKVKITYAESYSSSPEVQYRIKGIRDDSLNFELYGYSDIYYPAGGKEKYETFWFRTFRFIRVEVETSDEPLILHKPKYIETGYPLSKKSYINPSLSYKVKRELK